MAINAPEGTRDLLPDEALFWERFKGTAAEVFGRYGYLPIDTPIIEQTELFVRGIGEATDVVSKEMFTAISGENLRRWLEEGKAPKAKGRLSLRPEGTAGTVRAVVQHDLVPQGAAPAKLMYAGPMFRAERPQKGRQRQFNQIGVECLGAEEPTIDAEAIIMLMRFYEKVGIPRASMRLLLNSMGCEQCRPPYRELVKAYMDEHAAELCETCMTRAELNPLRAFDCKNETCATVMADAPKITDHLCEGCREHYDAVKALLDGAGIAYEEDPALVRGLDYYTRTGVELPRAQRCDLFVACVDDGVRAHAFTLVQQCRDAGYICEMDHQHRSLKSQFKLADKLGAARVAVLGPDELARGQVTLRDMASHEEFPVALDSVAAELSQALL